MSQANVELVQGVYEAFGRGDVDAVFAAMEPDIPSVSGPQCSVLRKARAPQP